MRRSHIFARELRGIVVFALVAALVVWLFARLEVDRLDAKERGDLANPTTTIAPTTTTSTTIAVDDNERLCSLSTAFRDDLSLLPVVLTTLGGTELSNPGGLPIDLGLHPDGPVLAEGEEAPAAVAVPPPRITNPERIDPVASGLLGEPQQVVLNFFTAASTLRLGLIDADFDATADHFADLVGIGEPAGWSHAEILAGDFSDRWTSLVSRPFVALDNTLIYIEGECGVRIGNRFRYRETPPELPELEEVEENPVIDPLIDPAARGR
ncbi:MAG: hypothetical protein ACR2P0_10495 [Acidimicrobiales bacterium]